MRLRNGRSLRFWRTIDFFVAMILSNASSRLVSQIGMPLNYETFEVWCANVEALVNIQLEVGQHWTLFYQFYCVNSVRWNVSCSLKSGITKSYASVDNDQIIKWKEFVKFGEKKMDKQVSAHLLVGLFTVGWLMEAERLEELKWIIPKLCAFAILSILQISINVGRFRGSHSQHLVMQLRKSSGHSLGKGGRKWSISSILAWRFVFGSPGNGSLPVRISEHTIEKLQTSIFGGSFELSLPYFDWWLKISGAAYTDVPLFRLIGDEVTLML